MKLEGINFNELAALQAERKFESHLMYPGAPNEDVRKRCENSMNQLIEALANGLQKQPGTTFVLSAFKQHLPNFAAEDTEERERVCGYCEQIMDIVGMESSEGVLNNWLYGFNPNEEP